MVECRRQAGEEAIHDSAFCVTREMREAGAAILSDQDLGFSAEEKAEAVYIAMVALAERPDRPASQQPKA